MSLPLLELTTTPPAVLFAALQQHGAALVQHAAVPVARAATALRDAQAYFDLPPEQKDALAIAASPHFRGSSTMHNERDWREQIHFGSERPAGAGPEPFWRLQGPNRWPDDAAWCQRVQEWLAAVAGVGRAVLDGVAAALGVPAAPWLGPDPYLLLKLIAYHPQPTGAAPRQGVAAHLDFSLVTLTLQDDVGGLQVRTRDGTWCDVPPVPGAFLLNLGELLQYVTGNRLVATPHRVVNPSTQRRRVSMPVFVNPSLTTTLTPALPPLPVAAAPGPHVHAVLAAEALPPQLPFGPAEWRRKGENVWCTACRAAAAAAAAR